MRSRCRKKSRQSPIAAHSESCRAIPTEELKDWLMPLSRAALARSTSSAVTGSVKSPSATALISPNTPSRSFSASTVAESMSGLASRNWRAEADARVAIWVSTKAR